MKSVMSAQQSDFGYGEELVFDSRCKMREPILINGLPFSEDLDDFSQLFVRMLNGLREPGKDIGIQRLPPSKN